MMGTLGKQKYRIRSTETDEKKQNQDDQKWLGRNKHGSARL